MACVVTVGTGTAHLTQERGAFSGLKQLGSQIKVPATVLRGIAFDGLIGFPVLIETESQEKLIH